MKSFKNDLMTRIEVKLTNKNASIRMQPKSQFRKDLESLYQINYDHRIFG